MRVVWTERARSDLESIADFIARDDPTAAEKWVKKLIDIAGRAAVAPLTGRCVPEFSRDDLREFLLRTYRIVYRVTPQRCEILTVFEGHRRFPRRVEPDPEK
jgi:plasmid stabilization system protein ParE